MKKATVGYIAIAFLVWVGCGIASAAAANAWTQANFDLGCGYKAHRENLNRSYIFIIFGPPGLLATFIDTGFFDAGFSLKSCNDDRACECGS